MAFHCVAFPCTTHSNDTVLHLFSPHMDELLVEVYVSPLSISMKVDVRLVVTWSHFNTAWHLYFMKGNVSKKHLASKLLTFSLFFGQYFISGEGKDGKFVWFCRNGVVHQNEEKWPWNVK